MIDEIDYSLVAGHILYHGTEQRLTPRWMTMELDEHGYEYDHDDIETMMRDLVAKGLLETNEDEFWTTEDGVTYLERINANVRTYTSEVKEADTKQ